MNSLPIIDISPLYGDDPGAWQTVAKQIDRACRQWGFFYIKGHPISPARIAEVLDSAHCFFALPVEENSRSTSPRPAITAAMAPSPPNNWTRPSPAT